MKLIVGLGNPGRKYQRTRHNIGFMVVSELAKEFGIKLNKRKYNSLFGSGAIGREKATLVLPLTYMNLSGDACLHFIRKKRVSLADLLVVCDDTNLDVGLLRLKARGSAGGHKGLTSIITCLGTTEFPRLRVGIGAPGSGLELDEFVLKPLTKKELVELDEAVNTAVRACETWANEGVDAAMSKFNIRMKPRLTE